MATAKKAVRRQAKSIYRPENQVIIELLRVFRDRTGLNQVQFAEVLGRTQSYVSAAERGAKMDTLQIRDWCIACGTDLVTWATEVERALKVGSKLGGRKI
ncbi:MAG TPA: helix-turn-helix transcriptional regulator [Dyella sp.]|uniref:helix-turn-helix domain-containing protein n=1 Tax=Dyella sp. TaxID=1869338 RepID=UPI002F94B50F